jgi:hypothetical protein
VRPRRGIPTIFYRYKEAKDDGTTAHSNNDSIGCNNIQQEEDCTYDNDDDADEAFSVDIGDFISEVDDKKNTYDNKYLRVAIGVLFAKCHDAVADKGMWSGPYGVRAEVRRSLDLDPRHNVDRVFEAERTILSPLRRIKACGQIQTQESGNLTCRLQRDCHMLFVECLRECRHTNTLCMILWVCLTPS